MLSDIRLVLCRFSSLIWENVVAEGLEIELPFPGGAEEAVPVCFV